MSQVHAADKAEGKSVDHQEEPLYAWGRWKVILEIVVIIVIIIFIATTSRKNLSMPGIESNLGSKVIVIEVLIVFIILIVISIAVVIVTIIVFIIVIVIEISMDMIKILKATCSNKKPVSHH